MGFGPAPCIDTHEAQMQKFSLPNSVSSSSTVHSLPFLDRDLTFSLSLARELFHLISNNLWSPTILLWNATACICSLTNSNSIAFDMAFMAVLESDLRALSVEARRRHPAVKDGAEHAILKVQLHASSSYTKCGLCAFINWSHNSCICICIFWLFNFNSWLEAVGVWFLVWIWVVNKVTETSKECWISCSNNILLSVCVWAWVRGYFQEKWTCPSIYLQVNK